MVVANGAPLRELRAYRLFRSAAAAGAANSAGVPLGLGSSSSSSQCRHFVALPALSHAAEAGAASTAGATPEAAAAEVAAKKTGRAAYWFVGVAGAAILGSLAYPSLVTLPPPDRRSKPPEDAPPPPAPAAADAAPSVVPALPSVMPTLSAREQLTQRLDALRADLAELRKEKRTQLIDLKKKGIKDEIKMIESGLKKLDKF